MKLIIIENCVGPKGVILERGSTVEVENGLPAQELIGNRKALNVESEKGKAAIKRFKDEADEALLAPKKK